MKNLFFAIIALLLSQPSFSQKKEYYFKPSWKAGEVKTLSITEREVEYENGKLKEDTTVKMDVKVTVLKDNKEDYSLKITYQNVVMKSAKKFYDKVSDELPNYRNLDLIYKVNKKDGKAELTNWKEAQAYMKESFNQMVGVLKKKDPEKAEIMSRGLKPVLSMFDSKESMESFMDDEIQFLLFPYGKKFVQGDTLKTIDSEKNPFGKSAKDTVSVTTYTSIGKVDPAKSTIILNNKTIFDMSGFIQMMKTMMEQMAIAFQVEDSIRQKKMKEMDEELKNLKMEVYQTQVITFNYDKTWVTSMVQTGKVIMIDPKRSMEKTVTKTVTVK